MGSIKAVEEEQEHLMKYTMRGVKTTLNKQADMFENTGINAKVTVGGKSMDLSDYVREVAKNPQKYADTDDGLNINTNELIANAKAYANEMTKGIQKTMSGDKDAAIQVAKGIGKADPLLAIMAMNPFDYANAWDILIQQYNVKAMVEKKKTLEIYMSMVNNKVPKPLMEVIEIYSRAIQQIDKNYEPKYEELEKQYNNGNGTLSYSQYELKKCRIREEHYRELNDRANNAFASATQITSVAYKKLERNIPRMYKEIMKHLVYIADEKVRQQQEDLLVGSIATQLQIAIGNVLVSYHMADSYQDTRLTGCEDEALRARLEEREREVTEESLARQRAAMNAFKNGDIDENSSFYKNYIKKYEYEIDLIVVKYRVNEHFSAFESKIKADFELVGVGVDYSTRTNLISGTSASSGDLTISLKPSANSPLSVDAGFGFSYVKDANGNIHPHNFDLRSSLGATVDFGNVTATAGMSASIMQGSRLHGSVTLTGNEMVDGWLEKKYGENAKQAFENMKEDLNAEAPTLQIWSGEYKFE